MYSRCPKYAAEKNLELVKEDILKAVQTCPIPDLHDIQLGFDYGKNTKRYACANKTQVGGIKERFRSPKHRFIPYLDGDKWICYEPGLAPDPKDCLVYSFGINNEWSFDDAMGKYGCQVYSFDPTMNRPNFKRGSNIYFKNLGLEGYNGTLHQRKQSKVDTLGNIMRMLGHEGRRIDYLKIDIEGSEVQALEQVFSDAPHLLTQVSQLGVEVHPGKYRVDDKLDKTSNHYRVWRIYHRLECLGFQLMHMGLNQYPGTQYKWNGTLQSCCYELVWVMPPPRPLLT
ncbi:hypothetical protein Pcinc_036333 [Petrolisthes cinctipes]|uniref:Methyltransferase domain-containing protein n=1 Tax=Petrolisthes cinctipes TaxID=88211 RepID=A0AAE1EM34_PETCI|nr:hypothetical protein Pcinc_036333 [Petrolisthes cinctipes]